MVEEGKSVNQILRVIDKIPEITETKTISMNEVVAPKRVSKFFDK